MKAITSNGSMDTLIEIANALAWLSYAIRHCAYDARFHELLIGATKAPVLVYSPSEDRGWVVPKLPVLQIMTKIYLTEYGLTDKAIPQDLDIGFTREKLLTI